MAKYDEGDEIRLTKAIMGLYIKPNTRGTIKKIKGGWTKEYHIRFRGMNHDVILKGDRNFTQLSSGEG